MISNQMFESNYLAFFIRTLLSRRFFSKIANGTVCLFSNCIGKIVRCHSDIIAMIINRKSKGKFIKNKKIKCHCPKCSNKIEQRNPFISTDCLPSMAYNHRVCRSERQSIKPDQNPPKNCPINPSSCRIGRNSGSNMIDVKSDNQLISRRELGRNIDKDWWTIMKENNDRMPPIKNTNLQITTRSECSSQFSGFRSTPETNLTQSKSDILTNLSTDGEEDVSITDRSTSYKNWLSKSEPINLSSIRCSRDQDLPNIIRIFSTRIKRTHGNFNSMICTKRHRDRKTIKNYLKSTCKSI